MKICGVVVLYNPTIEVNEKIKTYINQIDKLYVVDNSNNNNKHMLLKNKKIKYIPNYDNLGIAYSLNLASKMAFEEKYQWILTMDQDSKFDKNNLDMLIEYASECDYKTTGLISPWHNVKENNNKPIEKIEYVTEVMTSGNLVNLNAWNNINGWKNWFFIDNVDIEFCMNLNINNYNVIRLNYVELEHNLGNRVRKKIFGKTFVCSNHNYIRQYYMVRNLYYLKDLYYKYYPDYIDFLKRSTFGRAKNIILGENDKFRKIRYMIKGYIDYKHDIKGKYNYKG